jgi:hypothetical protein
MSEGEFTAFKQRFELSNRHLEILGWMLEFLFHYARELRLPNNVSKKGREA